MNEASQQNFAFSITTPIYYVNDLPHIGSAYTTMAADVLARFHRLRGEKVLLMTGTDEHGQKIQRIADELGRSPQLHCDQIVAGFQSLWHALNIHYDCFVRTTSPRHEAIVKEFFQRVWNRGDIYLGQQQGWYCVSCEEFKDERELLAEKRCPLHPNKVVEWRDEQNYFFRLSQYQLPLLTFYENHPEFIQPSYRRNEVIRFVRQGLQDFSVSRINLDWGFPIPNDPTHTIYVWFDALLNYITGSVASDQEPTIHHALNYGWPISLHLIGKDILRFHTVYWPAMLLSADMPLPGQIFVHGFLTKDGQKMSKSLGNTIDPVALVDRYGSDAIRYYFLKEIEFGKDGDFSESRFINILNADLANDLGNLLNRTIKMAIKYCDRRVPDFSPSRISDQHPLYSIAVNLGDQVSQAYTRLAFSQACESILTLIRAGNKYVDEQAPWSLYKQGEITKLYEVLYSVLESVRLAGYLLAPIIPTVSNAIYQQLGFKIDLNASASNLTTESQELPDFSIHGSWGVLRPGDELGEPYSVFPRLSDLTPIDSNPETGSIPGLFHSQGSRKMVDS